MKPYLIIAAFGFTNHVDQPKTTSIKYYGSNGTVNQESEPFVMFALNWAGKELEKEHVESYLGCNVKQVKGCYHDEIETSYLLPLRGTFSDIFDRMEKLEDLLTQHDQESYLLVDADRNARLTYLATGQVEAIGTIQKAPACEAIELGNWTLDGSQFWIVK